MEMGGMIELFYHLLLLLYEILIVYVLRDKGKGIK